MKTKIGKSCLSVIIPILNGMPFLPETLESLQAQTFQDFNVLVWDNGSTDGTIEELKKWIPKRLPGKIIPSQPRSVGASLASLVEMADTEFCARMDADDVCQPNRLEKQICFLLSHPEIALVGSQLRLIDEEGHPTGDIWHYPLSHDDIVHTLLTSNPIAHPSVMFRRQTVLEAGNYDSDTVLEDYDLWLRLAQNHKIANLPDCLVDYRIHSKSVMRQIEKAQRLEALLALPFAKHASKLFGISAEEAKKLSHRDGFITVGGAIRITRHLSRTQGGSTWSRLHSASLISSLRSLTRSQDVFSRIIFAMLNAQKDSIWCEFRSLLKPMLTKVPGGARLIEYMRSKKSRAGPFE